MADTFGFTQPGAQSGARQEVEVTGGVVEVDISDDATREVGLVYPGTASVWDIADRAARDLGGVDILTALPAGTNLIGKVGLDQTTPGTTNGVAAKLIDEAGAPYGVKHVNNKPRVSSMPYLYDIAEGNVSGHTPFMKLGYNGDVGSTEEDIWTQGGAYSWPASTLALEVVSSSANDTIAGTGIQKVRVGYLDGDYSEQSEVLDMNGATPVPLTDTTILRVNSLRATQVGTGMVAAGDITCRLVGGAATVYRAIVTGYTKGRSLIYTVPLGKTLYITSMSVFSGYTTSGKLVRWTGRAQVDDSAPTTKIDFFMPFFEMMTEDASFHVDFDMPLRIPATADIKISAISNGAGSFCSCAMRGWLE